MTGIALQTDIAALLAAEPAFDPLAITAGAGADGVLQNGLSVDRFLIERNSATDLRLRGLSAGLFIGVRTTLAAAATLTVTADAQTDNATGFPSPASLDHRASAQPPTIAAPSLLVGPGVLVNARDTLKQQYDLTGAERFLRCRFTADLSAAGVDTANIWGLWIFGGADHNRFQAGLVGSSAVV